MYGTHVVDMTTKETYTVVHKNVSGIPVVVMLHVINSFFVVSMFVVPRSPIVCSGRLLSFRRKLEDFFLQSAETVRTAVSGSRARAAPPHSHTGVQFQSRSKVAK